ncbi:MAG TPA: hypothetical protein VFS43_04295 [Polyangiaceae bacterium]|nr:hypothetical protein [Polyangiaceae bacterium]
MTAPAPEPTYVVTLTGRTCTEYLAKRGDLLVLGTFHEALRFSDQEAAEVYAQEIRIELVGDLYRVAVLPTEARPGPPTLRPK